MPLSYKPLNNHIFTKFYPKDFVIVFFFNPSYYIEYMWVSVSLIGKNFDS